MPNKIKHVNFHTSNISVPNCLPRKCLSTDKDQNIGKSTDILMTGYQWKQRKQRITTESNKIKKHHLSDDKDKILWNHNIGQSIDISMTGDPGKQRNKT